ncbi:MAG: enoyl-CoA hydratase-related protein, partial [Thermodesulfobacteriota bacterium]
MSSISYELDKSGIAILRFDNPHGLANKLSRDDLSWLGEFLNNIDGQLDMIENENEIRAVILYSEKANSFISGSDLREYLSFTLADEGRAYSLKAQEITERIESSRAPFIAAVNGPCLGMGLEIALSCEYRIGSENPATVFGMTGVLAGLIPCAGGTQRLPRLIGTKEALELIISGDTLNSENSLEIGLIDEIVPDEILLEISLERALDISNKEFKPRRSHFKGIQHTIVNENPIARKKLFNDLRKRVKKDVRPLINAPIMAIEALEVGMSSFNRGLHVESVYFGELVVSTSSRSLIRTQMALEIVQEDPKSTNKDKFINKISVHGANDLGNQIACLAASAGITTRIKAQDDEGVGNGLKHCYDYFTNEYDNHLIDELRFEHKFDLISAASDYSGIKRADIVIDCTDEDLQLKLDSIKEIEPLLKDDAVYLSSSIVFPIAGIASNSTRPEKVIGARIFEHRDSELIEISVMEETSIAALARVLEFSDRLGKTPIVVKGGTGSYTTRLELAYFNESLNLASEGLAIEDIE